MAAIEWSEFYEGWSLSSTGGQCCYTGEGGDDTDLENVRESLALFAPGSFGGLPRTDVDVEELGYKLYRGTVKFGKTGGSGGTPPATGTAIIRGNTRGGSQHITQAIEHISDHAPSGATAPDFKGAIGVDQDGNVAGCDVPIGTFEFEIVRYVSNADFTNAYLGRIAIASAKTNASYFTVTASGKTLDFSEQSCLYLGCTWSQRLPQGDWEVTMYFVGAPTITATVGDITGIPKKGWHYLWARYIADVDTAAGVHIMRPADAHVERVIETIDFSDLDP